MRIDESQIIEKLKYYFSTRKDVAFAFLFGSTVKGNAGQDSDLDIAVYFYPHGEGFDIEEDVSFKEEDEIWRDLERITGEEVDLVVLNRAASAIAAAVYLEGTPIIISNYSLYWKHFLTVTDLAEEYRQFIKDYIAIKSRSLSLSAIDKNRLTGILDFIETEIKDISSFKDINRKKYLEESAFRRNVERWIENLVNASIDIAKIIVASRKQPVPQTYREILLRLGIVPGFNEDTALKLSSFSKLRNILAHEYLDIKYPHIAGFVNKAPAVYKDLISSVKYFLNGQ